MDIQHSQAITDLFNDVYHRVWGMDEPDAMTAEVEKQIDKLNDLTIHAYNKYDIDITALELALDAGVLAAESNRPVFAVDTNDDFVHWFVGTEDEILAQIRAFDGQKCICDTSLLMSRGCKCGGN